MTPIDANQEASHVKYTKPLAAAATIAAAGSIGFFIGAPVALAGPATQNLGSQGELVDAAGNIVQGWTVSDLKVSSDTIPHAVSGTLWEATATDQAIQGGVTPIVSNFNARARNGETYRVLFGAATSQGVNPATLAQGEKTSGKIYFDVTGASPDSVVYNAGGEDLLLWVQAPAASSSGGGSGWNPGYSSGSGSGAPSGTTAATPGAAEATSAEPAAVEGAPGTEATEGSQGTPLPAGSQGTPLPEGTSATPSGSQGTPLPAGTGATPSSPAAAPSSPTAAPASPVVPTP